MKATRVFGLSVAFHACFIFFAVGQSLPVLKLQDGSLRVTGLNHSSTVSASIPEAQWKAILRVYTHEAIAKQINQTVTGTYAWHGDSLLFTPSFEFAPGETYHAVFSHQAFLIASGSKQALLAEPVERLELSFTIPKKEFSLTTIESVHPQADVLPENMLRMYICFSSPMMPGEAYDHITLLDENGKPVEKAFLIIDQELWDAQRKRFTLLFDPGRIKRGIQSNLDLGMPLKNGQSYQLVIDSAWRDAHGNFLSGNYKKSFSVTEAERTRLAIDNWKLTAPVAGSHQDLMINFDRPVDYGLAMKCITIVGARSGKVSGHVNLINSTQWRFIPDHPWVEDQYNVEVLPYLEDVAGNNFNNTFDIDLTHESRIDSPKPLKLSFILEADY